MHFQPLKSMTSQTSPGTLYIVATPIGNLEDMTVRAVKTLTKADLIAAEDTRHSRRLLDHYQIQTRMISCHEHNETAKTKGLIEQLNCGKNIALISDAGTPCISDPGYFLVSEAAKAGIAVIPIPGCNAAAAALSVSGLPTDTFFFMGFPPRKKQKQQQAIARLSRLSATLIFYESPRRISALVAVLIDILGNRMACLGREITKLHEEYLRGTLSDIYDTLETRSVIKGECTLLVQGASDTPPVVEDEHLRQILIQQMAETDMQTSRLAKAVAEEFSLPRKKVYDMILSLQSNPPPLKPFSDTENR